MPGKSYLKFWRRCARPRTSTWNRIHVLQARATEYRQWQWLQARSLTCKWAMVPLRAETVCGWWPQQHVYPYNLKNMTLRQWGRLHPFNPSTFKNQMLAWWSNNELLQTAYKQFQYLNHCGKSKTNNGHRWWCAYILSKADVTWNEGSCQVTSVFCNLILIIWRGR